MKAAEVLIYIKDKVSLTGLKSMQTKLGEIPGNIKAAFNSAPVRAFKTAVLAVAAALAASVVEGAKFNVQMARVWTMAGGGIKNFKELREEARGLAADFGIARSEMAKGMYNALSAGVDKANLEGFMRSAAQVAVADGSEISVAVDGITTVLNAFGIEADKTEEITDKLFQTVKQGKTTFGELAASLSNTASTAAAANIPLDQILAHIATLTAQGTPTAQATTQIRQAIIGMNKALGDTWPQSLTFQQGMKKVWEESGKSPTKLLKLVGSTEAMAAVLGGVGDNAATASEKLAGMADSAGAAKAAFDKVDQFRHWPTLLETARGALSKFGEEVDQRIRPFVVAVTEQIKEWTRDEALWDKIRTVMDAAADRLHAAAAATKEIVDQINSLSDLKVLAETIGDWLKSKLIEGGHVVAAYLAEKAPLIGDAIGAAIADRVKRSRQDSPDFARKKELQSQAFDEVGYGLKSSNRRYHELVDQEKTQNRQSRLQSAGEDLKLQVELTDTAKTSFSELFEQNLAKVAEVVNTAKDELYEADKAQAISQVLDMASQGMSTEEIRAVLESYEVTQDEMKILMDALEASATTSSDAAETAEQSVQAAMKIQTATAQSLEAQTKSNTALQSALETTTITAQTTAQTATQAVSALDSVALQQQQSVTLMHQIIDRINGLDFELKSMKV